MGIDREDPPLLGSERATLVSFLDWHRATLAVKCEGLTDDQLRRQSMPPSTLSLLGLVRHLAEVERTWFRRVLAGEVVPLVYSDTGDYQVAYDAREADVAEAFASWRTEVEHSRRIDECGNNWICSDWTASGGWAAVGCGDYVRSTQASNRAAE